MSNVMRSFVAAFGLAALTSTSSAQSVDNLPSSVCALDAKGVATIYTRVEANEFRPDVRSAGSVKREVGNVEAALDRFYQWKDPKFKPEPRTPQQGKAGTYFADSQMFVTAPRGAWVPRYKGSVTVEIDGWYGTQALGRCFEFSANEPDPLNTAPIIPAKDLPLISTGTTRLERYVEPALKR